MKKIVLLMIIVLLVQTMVRAQTNSYTPFPKEAVWNIWKTDTYPTGNPIITHIVQSMKGDTIINGITYIKYYDPTLKSAIRDDSVHKKVFCYDFSSKNETLLYDFNLKLWDTVLVIKVNGKDFKYWVADIDSVLLLDKKYHNRYSFNKQPPWGMNGSIELSPLVEGLGYFNGNKQQTIPITGDGQTMYSTICASANKKILIAMFGVPPNGEYCGAIITGVQTPINKDEFTLYPNPTNGKFQLRTAILNVYTVELINTLGERILNAELKNGAIEIDLSGHSPGIYFVTVYTKEGNLFSRKIIKN
jgi:hypothetical protein